MDLADSTLPFFLVLLFLVLSLFRGFSSRSCSSCSLNICVGRTVRYCCDTDKRKSDSGLNPTTWALDRGTWNTFRGCGCDTRRPQIPPLWTMAKSPEPSWAKLVVLLLEPPEWGGLPPPPLPHEHTWHSWNTRLCPAEEHSIVGGPGRTPARSLEEGGITTKRTLKVEVGCCRGYCCCCCCCLSLTSNGEDEEEEEEQEDNKIQTFLTK